ncbi:hypothetical protein D3C80_977160 [compost metagenome]
MINWPYKPLTSVPLLLSVPPLTPLKVPPAASLPKRMPVICSTSPWSTSLSFSSALRVGLTLLPLLSSATATATSSVATGASQAPSIRMLNCASSVAPVVSRMR